MKNLHAPPDQLDVYPPYKGAHTLVYGGYIWEFLPHHPCANKWGWITQHRLVGEDIVGRPLVQHTDPKIRECVHHKDENRLNNSPENLEVMTFSAHRSHHNSLQSKRFFEKRGITRNAVKKALSETKTIKEAAAIFGCDHNTLRNHYPDLLEPYKRRKPTKPYDPKDWQLDILKKLAASPEFGVRDAAKQMGVSYKTASKMCSRFGIVWKKKIRSDCKTAKDYNGRGQKKKSTHEEKKHHDL